MINYQKHMLSLQYVIFASCAKFGSWVENHLPGSWVENHILEGRSMVVSPSCGNFDLPV